MSEESIISLKNVNKWFGDFHVLQDVNLEVKKKERIVVCGPSGSGKSTMIRCINRLEEHQEGSIVVDGIELTGNLKNIDNVRKEVGMGFQQFNLFPHLSVKENITLAPIWVKKMPKAEAEELAMRQLEIVKIPEQANKYPGQYEAAKSLGMSYWRMNLLIILPQAIRISIPPIVNTSIGLFKDTTLVIIVGILDLLGIGRGTLADTNWLGLSYEIYFFVSLVFFIFTFGMSRYSLYLEKKLKTGINMGAD